MATPTRGPGFRRLPPDEAERRRALDIRASFLVRAPAGSGKTELLVRRILLLLATVDEPESVVAATFTRKAAAEMRARVLQALADTPPAEPNRLEAWELAAPVRARGWNLPASPSRLRISTLDSLALGLVGRMPWLSRLGAAPQPADDSEDLYREAAHATLQAVEDTGPDAEAARTVLLRFDNNAAQLEQRIAKLLASRDQWLPLVEETAAAQRDTLQAHFRELVESELAALRLDVAADPEVAHLAPPARLDALPAWCALAERLLTKAGTLRKKDAPPEHPGAAACAALHRSRFLPDRPMDDAAWQRLEPLLRLLRLAAAQLLLIFRARGRCDFTEVTLAAVAALHHDQEGVASPLAYALDAQLRHLLVDEFQDTSAAQFALVRALTADWQGGDGRTLFLVGDPMQSIYGFRAARVDLFLDAASGALPLLGPDDVLQLQANFRSQQGLVAWSNSTFAAAFPAHENAVTAAVAFQPAQPTHPAAAPDCIVHPVANAAAEADAIAQLVQDELRAGAKDIAILAHARAHLRAILPALRARGIPFEGRKLASLASSPVATDLLAITQALLNESDRVAWLAVLRAPWCGLTLADLYALVGDDANAPVTGLWSKRRALLSPDGQARAERVMAILQAAAAERSRQPLRALVEWCWRELGGSRCVSPTANPADADAFLDCLEAAITQSGFDPYALEDRLASIYAPPDPDAPPRVKVMTVHEAKGLEFDVVILPGLARYPPPPTVQLLHWLDWPAPGGQGARRWVLAARAERNTENAGFQYLGERISSRAREEKLRLLYVAATRAESRLHLFTELSLTKDGQPRKGTQLEWLWPAQAQAFLAAAPAPTPAAPPPPAVPPPLRLRRVKAGWRPDPVSSLPWRGLAAALPPSAEAAAAHTTHHAEPLRRRVGIALHAMLQSLADSASPVWNPARLDFQLRQAGIAAADLDAARARAAAALTRTLADARGRWILAPHADSHTEWDLTSVAGGAFRSVRVDRSFVEDGIRWVIDYKLADHEGAGLDAFLDAQLDAYRPQLAAYAAILAALNPRLPVRCALYFPLLPAWRASVTCNL